MATTTHETAIHHHKLVPQKSDIGLLRPDHKTGLVDWLTTTDHKKIGIMYGVFALFFLLVGGVEALLIRAQLAFPNNNVVSATTYNQLFTMHGTTMIFLAVMPINAAFFNYIMPLQIGARDVAFPRLNTFGLWTLFAGGIILNISWFFQAAHTFGWFTAYDGRAEIAPAGGWFGYAPLSSNEYTGIGTNFWILGLQMLGVSSLAGSFNFIVTIINMRAPGMTMMRLPVFTWMTLVTSFLLIFALPAIAVALAELQFDRYFNTNFFRVEMGGQPILWQHLFWIFGHPEVYILILPTMGMVSEVLPTFSKRPLFGYPIIVFSGAVIGFLGFAVWSHHMFTTGLGKFATAAFSLLTMAIAVPTGVKIFNWIGTLWGGRIKFTTPMIFSLAFIWMFMMGGFSGIMHSSAPADAQQQDSYFVIAHFHYVLIGGALLAIMSGLYYWFPKITGKMLSEKMGHLIAFLVIVGLNLTFFPMHYLGLNGMPRRTHTYQAGFGWETWNLVCTIGAFILGIGIFLFVIDIIRCARKGKPAGADPWDGRTLEWTVSSPPPVYNFARTPVIRARDCFFAHKYGKENERIATLDEDESHGIHMPSNSWWPMVSGIAFTIFGVALSLHVTPFGWVAIAGLAVGTLALFLWALEGPGGYHLHPEKDDNLATKDAEKVVIHH